MGKGKSGRSASKTQKMMGKCPEHDHTEVERLVTYASGKKVKSWRCKTCKGKATR